MRRQRNQVPYRAWLCPPRTLDDEARIALYTAKFIDDDEHLARILKDGQVAGLLTHIGRGADIDAVVTGAGVDPVVWKRMATTVLRYTRVEDLGVFDPTILSRAM